MTTPQTPIDTTVGTAAYALAVAYETALDPRLPVGTLAELAADLTTLGAAPAAATPPPAPTSPAPPAPPTLAQAMALAVSLISGIREAVAGARPTSTVRKAYGASSRTPTKEAAAVLDDGAKIVARAQANPAEALSLGILPTDVTALAQALTALGAAETAAKGAQAGVTAKARRAAETRMHEAVARIAGAGALAFATNAAVRAQFTALRAKKAA
jgi:hypothetical protein